MTVRRFGRFSPRNPYFLYNVLMAWTIPVNWVVRTVRRRCRTCGARWPFVLICGRAAEEGQEPK